MDIFTKRRLQILCTMRRCNITCCKILIFVGCMLNLISKTESSDLEINGVSIGFNRTCSSNPNVTCIVYFIKDVGCSAKAATAFPQLYKIPEDSRFPEKPETMKTAVINKIYPTNKKYYTGLKITLRAPVTGSFDVVKGFELIYTYNMDNKYGCLIFDLSAQRLTYQDVIATDFYAEIWPMSPADPPVVFLASRSLPPAPAQFDRYLNATEYIKQGDFGVCVPNEGCNGAKYSSQWISTITYKPLTNSSGPFNEVEMSFATAPPEYGFSLYTVSIYKTGHSQPDSQLNLTNENSRHVFTKLLPGTYVIKVEPFDTNFNLGHSRCLCNMETYCQPCITTITKNFTLGYSLPVDPPHNPSSTTTTVSDSTTGTTQLPHSNEHLPHSNENTVVATVLGVLLGLLLVIVLAFLFIYWRKKNTEGDEDTEEKYSNLKITNIDIGKDNSVFLNDDYEPIRASGRVLPKKTVFLAYAEDHEFHKDVLKSFASFLMTHCRCNVIFAPWRMTDIMQNKFRWVINSMDQADYIVIVNSITAYEQYKQWKSNDNTNSKILQGSPLADLFIPILNQASIRLNQSDYRKFIMVRFDYTQKEHTINDLNSGGEYVLMKHLQEFLCHIHQLEQHKTKMEDVGLAFVDDFTQLLEGSKLSEKIQKAREYEAKFPRRMNSETSTDSGLDSTESLAESDKQTIKEMYENNFSSALPENMDSITDVINCPMLGNEEYQVPQLYTQLEDPNDPNTFHPPSMIIDDETSEVVVDKMLSLISRNQGFKSSPMSIDCHEDNYYSDEESCRSIGGKSV